jgi:hypothetical protein
MKVKFVDGKLNGFSRHKIGSRAAYVAFHRFGRHKLSPRKKNEKKKLGS